MVPEIATRCRTIRSRSWRVGAPTGPTAWADSPQAAGDVRARARQTPRSAAWRGRGCRLRDPHGGQAVRPSPARGGSLTGRPPARGCSRVPDASAHAGRPRRRPDLTTATHCPRPLASRVRGTVSPIRLTHRAPQLRVLQPASALGVRGGARGHRLAGGTHAVVRGRRFVPAPLEGSAQPLTISGRQLKRDADTVPGPLSPPGTRVRPTGNAWGHLTA